MAGMNTESLIKLFCEDCVPVRKEDRDKTWRDVVRDVFPDVSDEECDGLLWEHTGFPCFWNVKDGETPADCARTQLRRLLNEEE